MSTLLNAPTPNAARIARMEREVRQHALPVSPAGLHAVCGGLIALLLIALANS